MELRETEDFLKWNEHRYCTMEKKNPRNKISKRQIWDEKVSIVENFESRNRKW